MTTKAHMVTHNGETHTLAKWGELLGLSPHTLWKRLRRGMPAEQILSKEKHARRSSHQTKHTMEIGGEIRLIRDVAAEHGLTATTIYRRLRNGWDMADLFQPAEGQSDPSTPVAEWRSMDLPWEADLFAQNKVKENPSGMELHQVADLMGVTKQRVEQIEKRALRKLKRTPGARAMLELMLARESMRESREVAA